MRNRLYFLTIGIVILDHLSKWLVLRRLDFHRPIDLVPGYLRLSHVQNTGVAFGLLDDGQLDAFWKPYALAALAVAAAVFIFIYASRAPAQRRLLHAALAVTLGGIVGNLIDRIARGFVVDFIEFHIRESFYWPTFNVADSAITIGLALLLIDTFRHPAQEVSAPTVPVDRQA